MSQLQRENRAVDVKPPSLPSNLEKIYEVTFRNVGLVLLHLVGYSRK